MSHGHRHTSGHEHELEPQRGLPELLPRDEQILWQGSPDWRAMALRAFHLRKVAVYFALMLALRGSVALADGATALDALIKVLWLLPLAALGLGLLALIAWLSARGTVYTLTSKRVVMRIGIVLTVTYNLPLKRIAAADVALMASGHGDIALALAPGDRIAWLQLWPHARPWRLARPEPALRAVPHAAQVALRLTTAWSAATGKSATAPERTASPQGSAPRAVLQGR
ncbi:MAG: PH domain-containing protein [Rubrivivax sp.]|nr:PH domain-containing protein [Rubrivivax sp.]